MLNCCFHPITEAFIDEPMIWEGRRANQSSYLNMQVSLAFHEFIRKLYSFLNELWLWFFYWQKCLAVISCVTKHLHKRLFHTAGNFCSSWCSFRTSQYLLQELFQPLVWGQYFPIRPSTLWLHYMQSWANYFEKVVKLLIAYYPSKINPVTLLISLMISLPLWHIHGFCHVFFWTWQILTLQDSCNFSNFGILILPPTNKISDVQHVHAGHHFKLWLSLI